MEPQPSTSTEITLKGGACDGGGSSDEVDPSTSSGGSVPAPQRQEEDLFLNNVRASTCQIKQLFGSTCRVKLQRCQFPTTSPVYLFGGRMWCLFSTFR